MLGLGAFHTFFFVVIPIMAGGVGEGAIPLSMGYSEILGQPQGDMFAQVLPPVMLGSLTAILLAIWDILALRIEAIREARKIKHEILGDHPENDDA